MFIQVQVGIFQNLQMFPTLQTSNWSGTIFCRFLQQTSSNCIFLISFLVLAKHKPADNDQVECVTSLDKCLSPKVPRSSRIRTLFFQLWQDLKILKSPNISKKTPLLGQILLSFDWIFFSILCISHHTNMYENLPFHTGFHNNKKRISPLIAQWKNCVGQPRSASLGRPANFYDVTGSRLWQYGFWSFQTRDTKLERFFPKNQHTQRKLLNFEFWINGELSKSAKI